MDETEKYIKQHRLRKTNIYLFHRSNFSISMFMQEGVYMEIRELERILWEKKKMTFKEERGVIEHLWFGKRRELLGVEGFEQRWGAGIWGQEGQGGRVNQN